jgi:hypothetical protein
LCHELPHELGMISSTNSFAKGTKWWQTGIILGTSSSHIPSNSSFTIILPHCIWHVIQ